MGRIPVLDGDAMDDYALAFHSNVMPNGCFVEVPQEDCAKLWRSSLVSHPHHRYPSTDACSPYLVAHARALKYRESQPLTHHRDRVSVCCE